MGADLGALAAAYAGGRACLAGNSALVLVDAAHEDPHRAGSLVAQLNHSLGAGLHAGAAGRTLALVDHGKPGLGVHRESTELAGLNAVAAAHASVGAARVAAVERGLDPAGLNPVVDIGAGTVGAAAVAAYHRHLRSLLLDFVAENAGYLLHHFIASHRTEHTVEIGSLDGGVGKIATAGKSASATVCTGHHLLHLIYARVFLDLELLGHPIEDQSQDQAD